MADFFQWSNTTLLLMFLLVALVIPGIVMYLDDDKMHHLH